ncbi:MAG: hypothetical protein ACLFSQ_10645 [Candidatus Zixiibacteriota bacterium]
MKRNILLILILVLCGFIIAKEPINSGGKIMLRSGDDEDLWQYHKFDSQNPLQYRLSGPKRYKLIVRGINVPDEKVEIKAALDGKHIKSYKFRKNLSRKTRNNKNNNLVTKGYIIYFKIPDGTHKLSLTAEKELIGRLFLEPGVKVSIAPLSFADDDFLIVEDEEYEYYFTSKNEPAVFRLIGPLKFTIFSRLSYFQEMHGLQRYTLILEHNGEIKNFHLEAEPSNIGFYRHHKDIIPSKASKTEYDIGPGEHDIKLWGENVAVKLYVPQSKLGNR